MTVDLPEPDPELVRRVRMATSDEGVSAVELLPLVYDELRKLAQSRLARLAPDQTLQATALVHEAWLRVVGQQDPGWEGRAHFFGAAARAMRNILVDQCRLKSGRARRIELQDETIEEFSGLNTDDLLQLDEALERLEEWDELKAELVMLRFFTGLTMASAAEVLGLPLTRIEREWRFTRTWLHRQLNQPN